MKFVSKKKTYPYLPQNLNLNQLDIWNDFLGTNVKINERFRNPLRTDTNPGAILREKGNYIRLFDPASEYHGMTAYEAIMYKYSVKYPEALRIAYFDILRGKVSPSPIKKEKVLEKRRCKIRWERRSWNKLDRSFWNGKTEITSKLLEQELTFPTEKFAFTDRKGIWHNRIPDSNTYHTTVLDKQKIYTPEHRFFLTNMDSNCIGGLKPFEFEIGQPRILLLTMNQKSYLCNINLGYNSRFLPHEGIHIPIPIMKEWDKEFHYIVSIMDNDLSGLLANQLMYKDWKEHIGNDKFIQAEFPKVKETYLNAFNQEKAVSDSYDYCKAFNLKRLDQEIQEILFNKL